MEIKASIPVKPQADIYLNRIGEFMCSAIPTPPITRSPLSIMTFGEFSIAKGRK